MALNDFVVKKLNWAVRQIIKNTGSINFKFLRSSKSGNFRVQLIRSILIFVMGLSFFFIFIFSNVNSYYVHYDILPLAGFEPRTSGIGSNRSTNCVTTTALSVLILSLQNAL